LKEGEKMPLQLEERVDSLEAVLGHFIVSTNTALNRMERGIAELKSEMKAFKDEMRAFKDESESDRKRMNKQWGDLANKMGTLVEDIVAPNIPRIAEEYFNVKEFDFLAIRIKKRNIKNNILKEFDFIAVSKKYLILNETKSSPTMEYVNDFIKTIGSIFDYFPEYSDKKIIPIFSSLNIPNNIIDYLTKNRIYAMAMGDDIMRLLNFEEIPS